MNIISKINNMNNEIAINDIIEQNPEEFSVSQDIEIAIINDIIEQNPEEFLTVSEEIEIINQIIEENIDEFV